MPFIPHRVVAWGIVAVLCAGSTAIQNSTQPRLPLRPAAGAQLLNELYEGVTGFVILTQQQANAIIDTGGAPTYGEMEAHGMQILLDDLHLTNKDVFVDLGSGAGRMVVYVYLVTPAKKAVGIELADSRHEAAEQVAQRMRLRGLLDRKRPLEFKHQNIMDANMQDATVVYAASLCFSRHLMRSLTEKLGALKPGLRFLTLQKIPRPANYGFAFIKQYCIPMSWSEQGKGDAVFLYELQKKKKRTCQRKAPNVRKTAHKKT